MPIRQSHLIQDTVCAIGLGTTLWYAQSFKLNTTKVIDRVRLYGKRAGASSAPGLITVSIYKADSSHKPVGSALGSGTTSGDALDYSIGETFDVTLTAELTLTAGREYCIVAKDATVGSSDFYLRKDSVAGYGDGQLWYSSDSGSTWTSETGDLYFAVAYGDFTGTQVAEAMRAVSREIGKYLAGTTDADGTSTTTLKSSPLADYLDSELVDRHVLVTSGASIGDERRISEFTQTSGIVTPRRAFTSQVVSGERFEIHSFLPSKIIEKLNWATRNTKYLFQPVRSESLTTAADTYAYDVPDSIEGNPLRIEIQTSGTEPYDAILFWEYDKTNHRVVFQEELTNSKTLRLVGKGRLTEATTRWDAFEAESPNIDHLYALALSALFQERMSAAQGTERSQHEADVAYWLNEAERRGREVRLELPQQTIPVIGWRYT